MLEAYRKHVEERAAQGVVPQPLNAEQVLGYIRKRGVVLRNIEPRRERGESLAGTGLDERAYDQRIGKSVRFLITHQLAQSRRIA